MMMTTIYISGHLKNFAGGKTEIELDSNFDSVGAAIESLCKQHLALRDRILNEQGEIRQHVSIFLGSDDVKRLDGLRTEMKSQEIHIFNAVSGG